MEGVALGGGGGSLVNKRTSLFCPGSINRSLSAIGNVIQALVDNGQGKASWTTLVLFNNLVRVTLGATFFPLSHYGRKWKKTQT